MKLPTIKVRDAKGCAWRARYLYLNDQKVAHLSVDPNDGTKPTLSGSVMGRTFRVNLPTLHWRTDAGPIYTRAYQIVRHFWHKVDGRF